MVRAFLCFPVFFWLLMPPGICLCHLPETVLATLLPGKFPPPPPHDHETEHPPGCTYRKMPLVEEQAIDLSQFAGVLPGVLLTLPDRRIPEHVAGVHAPADPLGPSHVPLYLSTLALRL